MSSYCENISSHSPRAPCGQDSITGRKYHECKVPIANEDFVDANVDCACGKYSYSIFHNYRILERSGVKIREVYIVIAEKEKIGTLLQKTGDYMGTWCYPQRHTCSLLFHTILPFEGFFKIEKHKCCCEKTIVSVFDRPYIEEESGVRVPQKVVVTYEI